MRLHLYIEIYGKEYYVGYIFGEGVSDACFVYDKEYMNLDCAVPVSVSMPFREEPFAPKQTRIFFEGLLPEGFTRRTVAHFIHADENDYLKILAVLGKECLGALRVIDENQGKEETEDYEEICIEEIKACVIIPNLTHNQRPYAFVENVITDVNYRNKGLATQCLNFAKEIAVKENCYKIMLLTGSKEESTLNFYRQAGYNSEDKTAFIQWI